MRGYQIWKENRSPIIYHIAPDRLVPLKTGASTAPQWDNVPEVTDDCLLKCEDTKQKGYKIWKEEIAIVDDDPAYHVMKDGQVPTKEEKSGRFLVQGLLIPEQEREKFKSDITRKLKSKVSWAAAGKPPDSPFEVKLWPVLPMTAQRVAAQRVVVEIKVRFHKGICFEEPEGPELYKTIMKNGKLESDRLGVTEWLKDYAPQLQHFRS
jgi:hypothetical protein